MSLGYCKKLFPLHTYESPRKKHKGIILEEFHDNGGSGKPMGNAQARTYRRKAYVRGKRVPDTESQ